MSDAAIVIEGAVCKPGSFTRQELMVLPVEGRIADVGEVVPHRQGEAVRLGWLLDESRPDDSATHVTLHSADGFSASIPLDEVRDTGLIIFQLDGQPLPESAGGPFRFLIPAAAACRTAEVDACANVKALVRIELTVGKGVDTRYGKIDE
ncbi:MAG: molybdopterin-dependent oxidoreductase [Rhodopirellula sp.]|nr:molybdopterin-dependent oxidoreductase [Rhodopirellula sp.]